MSGKEASKLRLLGLTGIYRDAGFFLSETESIVGRRPECEVVLNEKTISGKHARIFREGDGYMVEDLNSTNGTFVNGAKVQRAPIQPNDTVMFHKIEFRFINDGGTVLTEAAPMDVSPEPQAAPPPPPPPAQQVQAPPPPPPQPQQIPLAGQTPPPPQPQQIPLAGQTPQPQAPPAVQVNVQAPQHIQAPQQQAPAASAGGSGGAVKWAFIALVFNITVPFLLLLTQVPGGVRFGIGRIIQGYLVLFPFFHTHVGVEMAARGRSVPVILIIMAILILLGIIFGGFMTQRSNRGNPAANALSFASIYTIVSLFVQLIAMEFQFNIWLNSFRGLGIGGREPALAMIVGVLYILGVVFLLALIGASLGKSKE